MDDHFYEHQPLLATDDMLTAIQQETTLKVQANEVTKQDGPFSCPACDGQVVLKQGPIVAPHFAHKPPVTCEYGRGETDAHRRAKQEIANALVARGVSAVEIEKRLGPVIADVYCELEGRKVAVEVQISKLTMDQICYRTEQYGKLDVAVIWLVNWHWGIGDGEILNPCQHEKWLHVLYFGRVYYWTRDLFVTGVHFGEHMIYKEATDWGGGYSRPSKRTRTIREAPKELDLLDDFSFRQHSAGWFADYYIPKCSILLDNSQAWWKSR